MKARNDPTMEQAHPEWTDCQFLVVYYRSKSTRQRSGTRAEIFNNHGEFKFHFRYLKRFVVMHPPLARGIASKVRAPQGF